MQKIDSKVIELLRFPMMCLIVCMHSDIRVYCPWISHLKYTSIIMHLIINVLCGVAVPAFFFMSGMLFFRENELSLSLYKKKILSRLKTLLIPYLLWNLICIFIIWILQSIIPGFQLLLHKPITQLSITDFLLLFWDISKVTHLPDDQIGPLVGQFWFLQCLMLLVLLSPFIYIGIKKLNLIFPLIFGIIYVGFSFPTFPSINWQAFFYFILGSWFSINSISVSKTFKKLNIISCILFIFGCALSFFMYDIIIINNILILIFSFNIASFLISKGFSLPKLLTSASFFIFCFHRFLTAIMTNIAKLKILPTQTELQATTYFILGTLLVILFCVFFYWFMSYYMPKSTNILIGGRFYNKSNKYE